MFSLETQAGNNSKKQSPLHGIKSLTYIHISSVSQKTRCLEYCFLHCTCRILPAPHVLVEDEVCCGEFSLHSSLSLPLSDKYLLFRLWLVLHPCTNRLCQGEVVPKKNIPDPLISLQLYHLVNSWPRLFSVHLNDSIWMDHWLNTIDWIWKKKNQFSRILSYCIACIVGCGLVFQFLLFLSAPPVAAGHFRVPWCLCLKASLSLHTAAEPAVRAAVNN